MSLEFRLRQEGPQAEKLLLGKNPGPRRPLLLQAPPPASSPLPSLSLFLRSRAQAQAVMANPSKRKVYLRQ